MAGARRHGRRRGAGHLNTGSTAWGDSGRLLSRNTMRRRAHGMSSRGGRCRRRSLGYLCLCCLPGCLARMKPGHYLLPLRRRGLRQPRHTRRGRYRRRSYRSSWSYGRAVERRSCGCGCGRRCSPGNRSSPSGGGRSHWSLACRSCSGTYVAQGLLLGRWSPRRGSRATSRRSCTTTNRSPTRTRGRSRC